MSPAGPNLNPRLTVKPGDDFEECVDTLVRSDLCGPGVKGSEVTSSKSTTYDGSSPSSSWESESPHRARRLSKSYAEASCAHGAEEPESVCIWGGGELAAQMLQGVPAARPWDPASASRMRMLQHAARNHGCVDLMKYKEPGATEPVPVAVKVMPARWVRRSPQEFEEKYPDNSEQPWLDFATIALLNKREAPFACKLFGVFFDAETCYAVQSLANMGDFFSYCEKLPAPGPAREAQLKPILDQTFSAVRQLHDLGVGHRDLSLENFVLHDEGGRVQVKMIDYGMATLKRFCMAEVRGKFSYQAPEMHDEDAMYDVFLTDAFAVGVIVYAFSVYDYPWISTKPSSCKFWSFFAKHGFLKMVEQRKLRSKFQSKRLVEVMSRELIDLIGGLVSVDPGSRLCLGEACFQGRASASTCAWMPKESERSRTSSKDYWSGRFFGEREESPTKNCKSSFFSFSSKR